jgi:hypothetical protein
MSSEADSLFATVIAERINVHFHTVSGQLALSDHGDHPIARPPISFAGKSQTVQSGETGGPADSWLLTSHIPRRLNCH